MAEKTDSGVAKNLVIVESPAKAKTISRYLGKDYLVKASIGHIVDLPKREFGVKIENDFEPKYQVLPEKRKVAKEIKEAAKKAKVIYLAPDPDREGEAIAWHLADLIKPENPNIKRVLINEITKNAVIEALKNAGELDRNRFEAQQARRILDRLVGYQISPLLWKKIRTGLSAGRVQSVAVRLICEREREIEKFKPEEYWTIEGIFKTRNPPEFSARLVEIKGEKPKIETQAQAEQIRSELQKLNYLVAKVERKEKQRKPPEPFITARLQQEASKRFKFPAKKTMAIAQQLYEGIDLGPEGRVGLITYMRTDSVRVSAQAIEAARKKILELFGPEYLPAEPNIYKSKKSAQEAHEAIRPTVLDFAPEKIKSYLTPDQQKLYQLIYERFLASQMKPAIFDQTVIELQSRDSGGYLFRASGTIIKFPGFLALWQETEEGEKEEEKEEARKLPEVKVGEKAELKELIPEQHFTKPPPRYNEASLIKELEEKGIGRPSTYAQIVSTIQERNYVKKEKGVFRPTALGFLVNDILVRSFPDLVNLKFTAQMEEQLDEVEEGKLKWVDLLKGFYRKFAEDLKQAPEIIDKIRAEVPTELKCPKCGKKLVLRWSKSEEFIGCSGYPACDFSSDFIRTEEGKIELKGKAEEETGLKCPDCSKPLIIRKGKNGEFLGCSGYPKCDFTSNFERTEKGELKLKERKVSNSEKKGGVVFDKRKGIPLCPECGKPLVIRMSKRGEFLGCSGFPECKFGTDFERTETGELKIKEGKSSGQAFGGTKPRVRKETGLGCPRCGKPLVIRQSLQGEFLGCSGYPKCKFTSDFERSETGEIKFKEREAPPPTGIKCEKCGKPMVIKTKGKHEFLACSGYPKCENIKHFQRNKKGEIEIVEPEADSARTCPFCEKPLVYRRGKYGPFLACSGYPECKFIQPLRKKKSASEKE